MNNKLQKKTSILITNIILQYSGLIYGLYKVYSGYGNFGVLFFSWLFTR